MHNVRAHSKHLMEASCKNNMILTLLDDLASDFEKSWNGEYFEPVFLYVTHLLKEYVNLKLLDHVEIFRVSMVSQVRAKLYACLTANFAIQRKQFITLHFQFFYPCFVQVKTFRKANTFSILDNTIE